MEKQFPQFKEKAHDQEKKKNKMSDNDIRERTALVAFSPANIENLNFKLNTDSVKDEIRRRFPELSLMFLFS